jgi:hypothetical protein
VTILGCTQGANIAERDREILLEPMKAVAHSIFDLPQAITNVKQIGGHLIGARVDRFDQRVKPHNM